MHRPSCLLSHPRADASQTNCWTLNVILGSARLRKQAKKSASGPETTESRLTRVVGEDTMLFNLALPLSIFGGPSRNHGRSEGEVVQCSESDS
jgi:hypothetical protein